MEGFDKFFLIPFVVVVGFFVYRFLKHGGMRGMLYGSGVARTVGEVQLERRRGMTTTLRVHVLENGEVVLEQSSRALLAASINGVPLSSTEADRLIALLKEART